MTVVSVKCNRPTDTSKIGPAQIELLGKEMNYEGDFAILSATTDSPNQNAWIADMKTALKDPKYAKMKLVDTVYGNDEAQKTETRATAAWVIDQILVLLHPFMPFVTEELWQKTGGQGALIVADWPSYKGLGDPKADAEIEWVIALVSAVRSVRAEMNVPASAKITAAIVGANGETRRRAAAWSDEIKRLARLESIAFEEKVPSSAAQIVLGEATVALPLAGVIDFAAERARLGKELEKIAKDVTGIDARLNNPGFVAKAPDEVLEETRERKSELEARRGKVTEAMARLGT